MKAAASEKKKKKERKKVIGFQVMEQACIWMKAGVVNYRECDNDYDCATCGFDKSMRRAMEQGEGTGISGGRPEWVTRLQAKYNGASRPCRHTLTGRIDAPKICTLNYECYHCAFDQMLDEMDLDREVHPPAYRSASGFQVADGYYYHMGHTWARFEHGGRIRIGFDDFLVRVFGAAHNLDLPPLGAGLAQNQVGLAFHRDANSVAVLSPVGGRVLAVNHKALEHPEITQADPYHQGWLLILEPDMPKRNLRRLYYGDESLRWMEKEVRKLLGLLGDEYQELAATGGGPVQDIIGVVPELGWDALVEKFLHTVTQSST